MDIKAVSPYIAIVLIALPCIAGCPGRDQAEKVTEVIEAFDGVNIHTLDFQEIIGVGTPAISVLAGMLNDASKSIRWAAVMSLSAIGHALNVPNLVLLHIKKAYADEDISVRITAAELTLTFGDASGLPVLISALVSDQIMQPSEPPTPVYTQVMSTLMTYTTQSFSTKQEWETWWAQNKGYLSWSREDEKFK